MSSSLEIEEIEIGGTEFENAIRHTGFGAFNIKLIILCGLSMLTAVAESISMSYIITAAQCDLHLTLFDKTVITSIGFLGITISCLFWGFLSDLLGRQKLLVLTTFLSFIFGIASSMVNKAWFLIVCRFFNGVFNACPTAIIFTYVSECHSDKYRSKAISWIGSCVAATYVYLPGISWLILTIKWTPYVILTIKVMPWRLLIIILTFPNIIFCTIFYHFPESPKFLWSTGKSEECLNILRSIYEINRKQDRTFFPVNEFKIRKGTEEPIDNSRNTLSKNIIGFFKLIRDKMLPLFIMPLLPKTILSSLLQFGILLSGLGLIAWFPEIVNKIEIYEQYFSSSSKTICETIEHFRQIENLQDIQKFQEEELICSDVIDVNVFKITILYGILGTLLFTLIGFIINKVGKKMVLIVILSITGISGLLVNFMIEYNLKMIFLIAYLLCGMASNTAFAIQVDLFPTEHRAKAVAFAQMMGRLGGTMGGLLTGALIKLYCPLIFYLFSLLLLALIFASLLLPIPLIICKRNIEE